METIVDEKVDPVLLKKFEEQYRAQLQKGQPSTSAQFEYALCLVKSKPADTKLGVALLEDLLVKDDDGMAKRDYLYYLCLGYLRLKQYEKSMKFADALLRVEPANNQALGLKEEAARRMKKDGLMGAAMLGGAFLAGGAVLVGVVAGLASRRN